MFGSTFASWLGRQVAGLLLWQWLGLVISLVCGVILGVVLAKGIWLLAHKLVRRTLSMWDDVILQAVYRPLRALCVVLTTYGLLLILRLPAGLADSIAATTRAAAIAMVVWGLMRGLYAIGQGVADGSLGRDTTDPKRLARVRSLRTQIVVTNRIVSVVIFLIGAAAVALQFNVVRSVGVSLLASAGVAGVALGFAAQKSLGALLAGLQISVSQPIRIGDQVMFQGEFGTIEDIGLTYVTMKLWDERRLMIPTSRFMEEPVQNWSRAAPGISGAVFLRVAFETPIDALRAEVERVIHQEPLWDGRTKSVHVTDAGESALEVRVLVSAANPSALWDLRTSVREKLVTWLQGYQRGVLLPHARVVMTNGGNSTLHAVAQREVSVGS